MTQEERWKVRYGKVMEFMELLRLSEQYKERISGRKPLRGCVGDKRKAPATRFEVAGANLI